jgi:hypothetical protein
LVSSGCICWPHAEQLRPSEPRDHGPPPVVARGGTSSRIERAKNPSAVKSASRIRCAPFDSTARIGSAAGVAAQGRGESSIMNNAEHICCQVRWLTEKDQINRTHLVEIIEEILGPFTGSEEPEHFEPVNQKIHRLLAVADDKASETMGEA